MEGDISFAIIVSTVKPFQSTPSAWRETAFHKGSGCIRAISIHSLRMEGDNGIRRNIRRICHFNPLPPHGGRLVASVALATVLLLFQSTPSAWRETSMFFHPFLKNDIFQSTPSAWRETPDYQRIQTLQRISIHSLRMEGDSALSFLLLRNSNFNPLPPHGGRPVVALTVVLCNPFQSTPSAWRETAKLHRKAFFISPILVQSCKKGCKRLHSAPEKMVFFEKREKNLVRNLQHLSVRL